jgi:hypothetical protein
LKDSVRPLGSRAILRYWLPLEATWLMMAAEGPFLAALIARLADPKANLAAYAVITSLAWIVESPIMMILSASNSLVRDGIAYRKFKRFAMTMNAAVTAVMIVLLAPPVFSFVVRGVIGLPADVAGVTGRGLVFLVLWPGSIGYRRFYQGILIRRGRPRAVAAGTIIRLSAMAAVGAALSLAGRMEGASVGAAALGTGVLAEAAASRFMARRSVRELKAMPEADCPFGRGLSRTEIARFCFPLSLTSFLALSINPMTTFFLGRSRFPLESLAVLPVISSLAFLFRTCGIACQEVSIALLDDDGRQYRPLRRFAERVGVLASGGMALVLFTPLASVYLEGLSGLSAEMARFALGPARIMVALPFLEALTAFQRGFLVRSRETWPVVTSVAAQILIVVAILWVAVMPLRMVGALAAGTALVAGAGATAAVLALHSRRIRSSGLA